MKILSSKRLYFLSFLCLSFFVSLFIHNKSVNAAGDVELLNGTWHLTGNNGASEARQSINSSALIGSSTLRVTYDLHGLCALSGDASALIFDQSNNWNYVSLSNYGKNCFDGPQTVDINLSDFSGLNLSQSVGDLHTRFWYSGPFTVDITSIKVVGSTQPQVTPTNTPTPTPVVTNSNNFVGNYWNTPNVSSSPQIPTSSPTLTTQDSAINFDWGSGSPNSVITNDHFVARWTKTQSFSAGTYRFITNSDDGIRVWLDNDLLIDQWNDHALKTDGADRVVSAGNHQIKVEYYENTGNAVAKLNYSLISSTSNPIPTVTPTIAPTPINSGKTWDIQSVSSMKETKDKICGQDDPTFIGKWLDKAKELGVNYVAVETPYDNPSCGNSLAYTKAWVDAIRARGMKVWHRHMYITFEGIYGANKSKADYLTMISDYIKNNPSLFAAGDIFTPQPEPQNGGIQGFTGCDQGVCQYSSIADFNKWLRDAIDTSNQAFSSIGLGGQMKVGYYGLDGFVVWGCNNPDWHGILEDATVQKMGNLTIDHYPELIGQTMNQGLNDLQAKYPNVPIIIGEWGSAGTTDVEQQVQNSMGAAKRPGVVGFNYWHMGMGGNEALINSDFSNRIQYKDVQSFFLGQK